MPEQLTEFSSVLLPLVVILVLVLLFRRSRRIIASSGFRPLSGAPKDISEAAHDITGLAPVRAFRRGPDDSLGWLVEFEGAGGHDPILYLLIYRETGRGWPELAAFRTTDKIPRLLRKSTGGLYSRLAPLGEATKRLDFAADWQLFGHPAAEPVEDLAQRLGRASHLGGANRILALCFSGDYLCLWSDGLGLRPLLKAAPGMRQALLGPVG